VQLCDVWDPEGVPVHSGAVHVTYTGKQGCRYVYGNENVNGGDRGAVEGVHGSQRSGTRSCTKKRIGCRVRVREENVNGETGGPWRPNTFTCGR
jgi:hypothetical protein